MGPAHETKAAASIGRASALAGLRGILCVRIWAGVALINAVLAWPPPEAVDAAKAATGCSGSSPRTALRSRQQHARDKASQRDLPRRIVRETSDPCQRSSVIASFVAPFSWTNSLVKLIWLDYGTPQGP